MTNRFSLSILLVLSGFIASSVGCGTKSNPYYCLDKNPDDNCTEPVICEDNSFCAAPAGVCDTQTMTCVQCTTATASACTGTSPICGTDDICHGCAAHTDCTASNVCLPDGSCAPEINVAYVDPGGIDNASCTKAMPCTKVAKALLTDRPYVKFHGTTDEAVLIAGGRQVTFLADPNAKLTRTTGSGAIVTVQDDGTSLGVYDLSISNAPNSASGVGLVIPTASGTPKVTLVRVTVANNPGGGMSVSGGSLTVTQSTLSGNTGGGISASGGSLTITQSTVSSNTGGGISASGAFVIVGNVFFGNGSAMSTIGGVNILSTQAATNRLEFNSFNQNATQAGVGAAIHCIAGTFTARNNIMSNNGTLSNQEQTGGSCAHAYSIAQPGTLPAGVGNIASDPLFKNTITGDLHIQPGSPAIRAAAPDSDLNGLAAYDIDGDARISPADLGADELPR